MLFHHALHRSRTPPDEFAKILGDNLPGYSELVFAPSALLTFGDMRQFTPIIVDLFLVFARHRKRDCFVRFKYWATVKTNKLHTIEREITVNDFPRHTDEMLVKRFIGISLNVIDLRIGEYANIIVHRLFGVIVEPKTGNNRLCHHNSPLLMNLAVMR